MINGTDKKFIIFAADRGLVRECKMTSSGIDYIGEVSTHNYTGLGLLISDVCLTWDKWAPYGL